MNHLNSVIAIFFRIMHIALLLLASAAPAFSQPDQRQSDSPSSQFQLKLNAGAISSLKHVHDSLDTEYVISGRRLGDAVLRYRKPGGDLREVQTAKLAQAGDVTCSPNADGPEYDAVYRILDGKSEDLLLKVHFTIQERAVLWTLNVENLAPQPVEICDLAIPLPIGSAFGRNRQSNVRILKHSFISGHGSYLFWMRSNNAGPYLMLSPLDDTQLEYWNRDGGYSVFIHSAAAGATAKDKGCNWRQPNTSLTLAPTVLRAMPGRTDSNSNGPTITTRCGKHLSMMAR